ncbi:hypothetical protein [Streptomyces sp. NPDC017991]|uniref:hypothetical protein n=1 Tax=Streptomyces sp. NPDC017991 TaxID=3365026 RepID=UPI0037B3A9AD
MLTDAVRGPALPAMSAAEPKWDAFRAGLSVDGGQDVLRSRRGTQMRPAFPEVVAGAAQLPDAWLRSSQRVSFVDESGCQLRAEQASSVDEFECHSGVRGGVQTRERVRAVALASSSLWANSS